MVWETIGRPGQTGFDKEKLISGWNSKYGEGNWRKVHMLDGKDISKLEMFHLCENSYYNHAKNNIEAWVKLANDAKDVYDYTPEEVNSGMDYSKQLSYTRFHDIAIRRVMQRIDLEFKGDELIQIRWDEENPNWYSETFDPGKVPFYDSSKIPLPLLEGWWDSNSIECAYQSMKYLQAKK